MSDKGCADFVGSQRISRRKALEIGRLGALGLTLPGLWSARHSACASGAEVGVSGFGKAKRCLILFMWGGPSQLETWDLKPEAPDEIRGEFRPIETRTPGISISEHFPKLAQWTHRLAIIRSMTHEDPAHLSSAHHLLTGHHAPKRFSDADPPSERDWPHLGSLLSRLRPTSGGVPSFVTAPWIVAHPAAPGGRAPGQTGGFLGPRFDPLVVSDPNAADFRVPGIRLPDDVPAPRLRNRRELLSRLESSGDLAPATGAAEAWTGLAGRAFDLLMSDAARGAFRLESEPEPVRDRYGRNTHGQSVLLARRLLEAGVPLVTVNWHDDGKNFWDTHGQNFEHLKNRLMPPNDQAFSALLEDLEARGMLDETLIVWVGEFGRNPRITRANAGREHWPRCFSAVLAGGGIRGGTVYGASDRIAAYPADRPTSPGDLAATMLHALGVDGESSVPDQLGVPKKIGAGEPLTELFG